MERSRLSGVLSTATIDSAYWGQGKTGSGSCAFFGCLLCSICRCRGKIETFWQVTAYIYLYFVRVGDGGRT